MCGCPTLVRHISVVSLFRLLNWLQVDQGICGSCWSHGMTAAISGAYFLKYNEMHIFSKQELVDCSWNYGNFGCGGGEDFLGYQWIMANGGLATRDNYGPYLMQVSHTS